MEGKTVAVDSSIWIYQFQATMRDKEGRALVNAHVLGFLRRICKLLFYGIKPVFVFDGGAPILKKHTIAERKRKKTGAADSHAKIAQKLLAAQMRREALLHVQKSRQNTESTPSALEENTVYLEDLIANPSTARPESAKKKNKFHDYDPYRLPDVDPTVLSRPTTSLIPDPRLATEDELREFIETMRPEDFDVSSPAFRELPTEVQYEIIGDLRLKSRQTSHKRLQTMLRNSHTPLDFSMAQIKNLKQRNALTQQLLETTDSIGRANVVIPVRIASERNKEYVLVKNEGAEGGWVLGLNDEGTRDKPIEIDDTNQDNQHDDDSDDMEEVDTTKHGRMPFAAVAKRHSHHQTKESKEHPPKPKKVSSIPLFWDEGPDDATIPQSLVQAIEDAEEEERALELAIEASNKTVSSQEHLATTAVSISDGEDEDLYAPGPSRLEAALAFANTPSHRGNVQHIVPTFGTPVLLLDTKLPSPTYWEEQSPSRTLRPISSKPELAEGVELGNDEEDDHMEEVPSMETPHVAETSLSQLVVSGKSPTAIAPLNEITPSIASTSSAPINLRAEGVGIECVEQSITPKKPRQTTHLMPIISSPSEPVAPSKINPDEASEEEGPVPPVRPVYGEEERSPIFEDADSSEETSAVVHEFEKRQAGVENEEFISDWEHSLPPIPGNQKGPKITSDNSRVDEAWDAAEEMDIFAEEGDFAELVSQMKNQDLEMSRKEIDEEIKVLNKQRKAAMRDSEDVSQHMVSQIMLMLRLFGLPYITAPMEAEAQCAALVTLGLVEGIITDDSDVFLFGGIRVYKNMFNQSKTVECFLLSDLGRELGLDRDKLIRLAYLLGSDYVEGLAGVGPVVAMELLKEFPGDDGLYQFKKWWTKVQSGRDNDSDTNSKFKKSFKKRFKNLYLAEEWPNPAVRDAYYHPTVDESEEPFKWGLPDLDALYQFLRDELSWSQAKVDELLVPIIKKLGQRRQATNSNQQGTLNNYFDVSFGSGTYAPRRRQAYSSKRLQKVVTDFRAAQRGTEVTHAASTATTTTEGQTNTSTKKLAHNPKAKKTSRPRKRRKKDGSDEQGGQEIGEGVVNIIQSAADEDGDVPQPPAMAAKLRVRPKQRYKETRSDDDGIDDTSGDELFASKRSRKG